MMLVARYQFWREVECLDRKEETLSQRSVTWSQLCNMAGECQPIDIDTVELDSKLLMHEGVM